MGDITERYSPPPGGSHGVKQEQQHHVHTTIIPHSSATPAVLSRRRGSGGGDDPPSSGAGGAVGPAGPHYPPHFMKGSIIQLANGELKRVEDLRTDDFIHSADISPDLKIDSSTVVRIDEQPERGTAILGFSVGEQHIQVCTLQLFIVT